MKLESISYLPEGDSTKVLYTLKHTTPGRNGTCLSEQITVKIGPTGWIDINLGVSARGESVEAALDKLQNNLERLAEALRDRRAQFTTAPFVQITIPVA